jgi:hypothetical protein
MIALILELIVGWAATGLLLFAGVLLVLGHDGWWQIALISLPLWIAALALHRCRHGRIDLFDDT